MPYWSSPRSCRWPSAFVDQRRPASASRCRRQPDSPYENALGYPRSPFAGLFHWPTDSKLNDCRYWGRTLSRLSELAFKSASCPRRTGRTLSERLCRSTRVARLGDAILCLFQDSVGLRVCKLLAKSSSLESTSCHLIGAKMLSALELGEFGWDSSTLDLRSAIWPLTNSTSSSYLRTAS